MGSSKIITNISGSVGIGEAVTVRPPLGEGWLVTDFSNNAAFVSAVPDIQAQMVNGFLWQKHFPDSNWHAVASDSDGSNLIAGIDAGRLHTSADFGASWTERQPAGNADKAWYAVASDSDGSNLIAGVFNGRLYTSNDSGATWTERQPAGNADKFWISVASDDDGTNLIACVLGGRLYTSANGGLNWTERQPAGNADKDWWAVASDSDGTNLIVGNDTGRLYTSANGGVNWTERQPAGDFDLSWEAVASDSDGSFLIAGVFGGRLYTSANGGVNWTERQPGGAANLSWQTVASDSDGSSLIAGILNGRLYTSNDSGATWTERQPAGNNNKNWISVSSDSDGTNLIACVAGGKVYTYGEGIGIVLLDPTANPGKRTRQLKLYLTHDLYLRITNESAGAANIGWFGEKVNVNNIRSGIVTIPIAGYNVVRPPVGETWLITEWGTSEFTTAGDINPACEIGLTDGTLILSRFILPTMVRGQDKLPEIYINHNVYLNVYSTPGCDFFYSAVRVPETCISSVTDVVGSATLDIQPPIGDEWVISEIGAETWAGGGAPNDYPNITVLPRTTVNSQLMASGAGASVRWNTEAIFKIDRTHFIRITEISTANNEVCISGKLQRSY